MNDDLENMKQIWQQGSAHTTQLDASEVEQLLRSRSHIAMRSLQNSIILEVTVAFVLCGMMVWGMFCAPTLYSGAAILQVLLLTIPMGIFYYKSWKQISTALQQNLPLKSMLGETIIYWERNTQLYYWFSIFLLPVVFLSVLWWRREVGGYPDFFTGSVWVVITKFLVSWVSLCLLLWGLVWVSYGKHLNKLKAHLRQLE